MPETIPGTSTPRLFAVVPAAGHSRRMGRPKLLLPWGNHTVIEQVITVLHQAGCTAVTVVVRPDDEQLAKLLSECESGCDVVLPAVAPVDMRASVEHALHHVQQTYHPAKRDAWLLVPGDHPSLRCEWITALRDVQITAPGSILVPTHSGRRGHPVLFPWSLASEVPRLPASTGANHLLQRYAARVREVPIDDATVLVDIDTPDDYRRQQPK